MASSALPGPLAGHGDRACHLRRVAGRRLGLFGFQQARLAPAEGPCWLQKAAEQEVGPGGRPPSSRFCADCWGGLGRPPQNSG